MEINQPASELELRTLYRSACLLQTENPRASVVLAKQVLKIEPTHLGAWNLIYQILGNGDPAGIFEDAFIKYNITSSWGWYQSYRQEKYIAHERAQINARLHAWRQEFDEQNKNTLINLLPGFILVGLAVVAGLGVCLAGFGTFLNDLFWIAGYEWTLTSAGTVCLALSFIIVTIFGWWRFRRIPRDTAIAPQAPAAVRWAAIEAHFQKLRDELERGDTATLIPDSFALFINPRLPCCTVCGRTIKGDRCLSDGS